MILLIWLFCLFFKSSQPSAQVFAKHGFASVLIVFHGVPLFAVGGHSERDPTFLQGNVGMLQKSQFEANFVPSQQ